MSNIKDLYNQVIIKEQTKEFFALYEKLPKNLQEQFQKEYPELFEGSGGAGAALGRFAKGAFDTLKGLFGRSSPDIKMSEPPKDFSPSTNPKDLEAVKNPKGEYEISPDLTARTKARTDAEASAKADVKRAAAEKTSKEVDMPQQNMGNLRAKELELANQKQIDADAAYKKTSQEIGQRRATDVRTKEKVDAEAKAKKDVSAMDNLKKIGAGGVIAGAALTMAPNKAGDSQAAAPAAAALAQDESPEAQIQKATSGAKSFGDAFKAARAKAEELHKAGKIKDPSMGQFKWGKEGEEQKEFQTNKAGEKYVPMKKQTKVNESLLSAFNDIVNSKHSNIFAEAKKKGKDQDADGDKDFADVMIARMMASGMSKDKAIAKVKSKTYNEGVVGIPVKKPKTEKGSVMPGYDDEDKPSNIKPMPKTQGSLMPGYNEEIDPKIRPRKDPYGEGIAKAGEKAPEMTTNPEYETKPDGVNRSAKSSLPQSVVDKMKGKSDKLKTEEVEELDERNMENKEAKDAYVKRVGNAARKSGDPKHLTNVGTGIRTSVANKIRGRELTQGRNRVAEESEIEFSEAELEYFSSVMEAVAPTPKKYAPNGSDKSNATGGKSGTLSDTNEEIEQIEEGRGKGSGKGRPKGAKSGSQHGGGEAAGTPHIVDQIKNARTRGIADGKGNYMLKHPVSGETKAVPQSSANKFYMEYHNSSKPEAKNKALSAFYAKHGFSNTEAEIAPKEDPKKRTTLEPKKTGITLASITKPKS